MSSSDVPPQNNVLTPTYRALRYSALITGQPEKLLDYYVEAADGAGNIARSPIQHVWVGQPGGTPGGDAVSLDPNVPVAGQNVKISYDPAGRALSGATSVYLHYGFNTWNPIISPDPAMTWNAATSRWEITVPVLASATKLDLVFNNGSGTWDNNSGADWHFTVDGGAPPTPQWVIDGQLDAGATLLAENGTLQLYAGVRGTVLYVAAPDAGEGNDHFILGAETPGAMTGAPWAKSGQVAAWAAYIGNETDNNWCGWFDTTASPQVATGGGTGWLEGTIDLVQEFGHLPSQVHVSFAAYGTANGGALNAQIPATVNGDGNIDASEYAVLPLRCAGDGNCDRTINWRDIDYLVAGQNDNESSWQALFASPGPTCGFLNLDCNADGHVNWRDIDPFIALMNTTCP